MGMTVTADQAGLAARLRELHHASEPLVLVNAWDAISARIVESLGFPAVATTSAGVAFAEGYPDGEVIPREIMLRGVERIARAVRIPVTADSEAGYGPEVDDARATAAGVLDAGAVGINFEDGTGDASSPLFDAELQAARIRGIRALGESRGVPLVINARTDACFHDDDSWDDERRIQEAIERGNRYLDAGADCIFIPGVSELPVIRRLTASIRGPVNVLATAAAPPIAELKDAKVARVSLGSGPIGYALAAFRNAAETVRDNGTFTFLAERIPHGETNALLSRASR